jgi:glycosyltransferase involved in cell wall biosynthesis
MKDNTKVSIITICYNEVDTIDGTLRSVISQSYYDYEWIVIDGGSYDGTKAILEQYKSKFKHYLSGQDHGIYDAMNKGINLARGQYLIFMNGGDSFYSSTVIKDVFSRPTSGDIIYGDINIIQDNTSSILKMPSNPSKKYLLKKTIPHQATFTKRVLFEKIGSYDRSYKIAGDFKFTLEAIFKYKCKIEHVPIVIANFNRSGVGFLNPELRINEKQRAIQEVFGLSPRAITQIDFFKILKKIYVKI